MAERNIFILKDVNFGQTLFTRKDGKIVAVKPIRLTNIADGYGSRTYYTMVFATGEEVEMLVKRELNGLPSCKYKLYNSIEDAIEDKNQIMVDRVDGERMLSEMYGFKTIKEPLSRNFGITKWVWDGYQPKQIHFNHTYFTITNGCDGWQIKYVVKENFYNTREECAQSHSVEVVCF